jgi:hypothetical protein
MFNGANLSVQEQLKNFYDVWGTDQTYNHMAVPQGWVEIRLEVDVPARNRRRRPPRQGACCSRSS